MYKLILFSILSLVFLLTMAGCQRSRVQDLQERLDAFREILPQDLKTLFDSKNYSEVVRGIDSLLQVSKNFKIRYEKIKDAEAINVFTSQEMVDFFKAYFVEEIEKTKNR